LNVCGARRITLYPVQDQSCTKVPHTNGSRAQGSKGDGTYLHTGIFSAMVFGGHTSTLDRYVDTVSHREACGCSLKSPFLQIDVCWQHTSFEISP
jgi:hypothetical protein